MLFGIAFQGLGGFCHPHCQMNGTGGSFTIEDATVRSLSFVCVSAFEFVTGSSCWGGTKAVHESESLQVICTSHPWEDLQRLEFMDLIFFSSQSHMAPNHV
jgi:hypothetical protein